MTPKANKYKKLKETGLCGKWEDTQLADAIISDIKSHRNWFGKGKRLQ